MLLHLLLFLNTSVEMLVFSSDIKYKKVAIAISRHETGNGKYIKNNNLFGFKAKSYKKYPSKSHSVADYKRFEARIIERYDVTTREQYLRVLGRIYAKDPNWSIKIRKMI